MDWHGSRAGILELPRRSSRAGKLLLVLGALSFSGACRAEKNLYSDLPLTPASLPAAWTPTTEPAFTPPAGWLLFESPQVEIWLPDSYKGGDPVEDIPDVIDEMRAEGGHFAEMADVLESNPGSFLLWVFDMAESSSEVLTNLTIVAERVPDGITIEEYLEAAQSHFPGSYHVLAAGPIALQNEFESGSIMLETSYNGLAIKEAVYVFKAENTVYGLTFTTGAEEFDRRLAIFKQAAETFHPR